MPCVAISLRHHVYARASCSSRIRRGGEGWSRQAKSSKNSSAKSWTAPPCRFFGRLGALLRRRRRPATGDGLLPGELPALAPQEAALHARLVALHGWFRRLRRMGGWAGLAGWGLQSCPISGAGYSASGGRGPAGCGVAANECNMRGIHGLEADTFIADIEVDLRD